MRAYVIKNKEGRYLAVSSSNYEHYWSTIDFAHYFRFLNGTHDAKQEAEDCRNTRYPDCEVVEITIAEGDLEKQLAIVKKALEMACETIKKMLGNKPYYICGSAIAERLGIPMLSEIKDYNYFIDEAEKLIEGESK